MRAALAPLALVAGLASAGLAPTRWQRLPTGVVQPTGWLRTQAKLQADSLTSHLPRFWPEIANTSWLGGDADTDGGLHESTPYWLNGAVPLALQLGDDTFLQTVQRYIDGILTRQRADGWLGPDTDPADFWSRYDVILAFAQLHESLPAGSPLAQRLASASVRFFDAMSARMASGVQLQVWSTARAHDLIWAVHYFADALAAADPTAEAKLLAFAAQVKAGAFDWHGGWFDNSSFPMDSVPAEAANLYTHGVNQAQAVKHGAVWGRQSGNLSEGVEQSWHAWDTLMRHHGQPHGVFAADEHLGGRMPSRGSELCLVVEAMWSLELLAQASTTDSQAKRALDALETVAFNALPGGLSADLWSHNYLQFPNAYQAVEGQTDHVWVLDGPDSAMYGLAPQYECCTANFHQGYPKLIAHMYFLEPQANAVVSAIWAPSKLSLPSLAGGTDIELVTDYPFGIGAKYIIRNTDAFTLRIRLPAFLRKAAGPDKGLATVRVWVEGHEAIVLVKDGFLDYEIPAWPLPEPRVAVELSWAAPPEVVRSDAPAQGASVFVGPLLMALDVEEQRTVIRRYAFESADFNTTCGRETWRYALPAGRPVDFSPVLRRNASAAPQPHARGAARCPLTVNATLTQLPAEAWPAPHGAPGPLPGAWTPGPDEVVALVPYACTSIRISAFPQAAPAAGLVI